MHEFLLRIRAQILWSWSRLDEAEDAARAGLKILANYQPQQQLQCIAMLAKCSLARGDLDNANTHLQRCEALLHGAHYHRDWLTNTDKSRVIHWQMTGDTAAAAQWLRHTENPVWRTTTSRRANGATSRGCRSCSASTKRPGWCWMN